MNVTRNMAVCSATVLRVFKDLNPALSWYAGAVNDLMDQMNGHVGRNRTRRLGAISSRKMGPLGRIEEVASEILDQKEETAATPLCFLHPVTYWNLRQRILGQIS